MRKLTWCVFVIALLAGSCIKNESGCPPVTTTAPPNEQQLVMDYITSNSISAVKHPSGLYYSIESFGSGNFPNICSSIKVKFDGYLTNGSRFEYGDVVLNLQLMLPGWRIGVPLIKPGGRIKLYLPPSLAYGGKGKKDDSGNLIVPVNAIVIYDITLNEFY